MSRECRSKNWVFTSFNVTTEPLVEQRHQIQYLVYGKEFCPTSKRAHLQCFVSFKVRTKFSTLKKWLPDCHIEVMRGSIKEASDYCKKDNDFKEFGVMPASAEKGCNKFKEVISLAKSGKITEIEDNHPGLYLRYKRTLETLKEFDKSELNGSCGVWINGPPRSGKDFAVRSLGDVFNKPLNKWWDGYGGEENILLSDVEPSHGCWLGYFLKIWADRYVYIAEIKGGSMKIRPKKIYVTSNFKMEEVFSGPILEALRSRFTVYDFSSGHVQISRRKDTPPSDKILNVLLANELPAGEDVPDVSSRYGSEMESLAAKRQMASEVFDLSSDEDFDDSSSICKAAKASAKKFKE